MTFTSRRTIAALAAITVASLTALAAPTAALAEQTAVLTETESSCDVSSGTLTWGVRESFRAYISGTIANGSWEASDGASYETPNFTWSEASGQLDSRGGTGSVSFEGTVHFTGHDGALDLTLANPTIEFEGEGKAALLLDVKSTNVQGEVAVDKTQAWVAEITEADLVAAEGAASDALELSDLPATLTSEGAAAFAGFYEAGEELDPISLSLDFTACALPSDVAAEPIEPIAAPIDEAVSDDSAAASAVPWLPLTIAGVALLVIGFTSGVLFAGRGGGAAARAARRQAESDISAVAEDRA